jgi:hypothetical protein
MAAVRHYFSSSVSALSTVCRLRCLAAVEVLGFRNGAYPGVTLQGS